MAECFLWGPKPEEVDIELNVVVGKGVLSKLLRTEEYNDFNRSAIFESDFIQVTRHGTLVNLHNSPTFVTLGVTSSVPCLPLPNVLLIARINKLDEQPLPEADMGDSAMELSRLLPLRYVRLSIHNKDLRLLKLRTATHRNYYLQLHDEHPDTVFELWTRLVHILHCGLSITCKDPCIIIPYSFVHKSVDMGPSSEDSDEESWTDSGESQQAPKRKRSRVNFTFPSWPILRHFKRKAEEAEDVVTQEDPCTLPEDVPEATTTDHGHQAPCIPGKPQKGYCFCKKCDKCTGVDPCKTVLIPGKDYKVTTEPPLGMNVNDHGLWVRDVPTGMMPLSRLSSLIAFGETSTDPAHSNQS